MRPYTETSEEKRQFFRSAFIAYSIFMVNGNNILSDRDKNISKLIKTIQKMNMLQQDKIFTNLSALNEKSHKLYPLTEVYSFENKSRFRWLQVNGSPVNHISNTGISGTENLGMNHVQTLWTALNRIYDKKDEAEKDWANAKFVGSCMAGKGIKSVEEKDKMRIERERVDREELKMKVLREYLNRNLDKTTAAPVELVTLPDGRQAEVVSRHRADSAEDLADQLSSALNGEKDAHDLAVEAHFRKYVDRVRDIEAERKRLIASTAPRLANPDTSSEVISREEAESRVKRLREVMLRAEEPITPNIT